MPNDLSAVNDMSPHEAAEHYAARGYRVVIVHGVLFDAEYDGAPSCTCPDPHANGKHGGVRCDSIGKHPRFKAWAVDPSTTEPSDAFARYPDSNVGLAMGVTVAGDYLVALDLDGPAGAQSLATAEAQLGELTPTLTSATGRGEHRVFRLPPGIDASTIRNAAGGLLAPDGAALQGLDVRAEGGQIVVAPSMHASGEPYQWTDGREPVELPEAWARWLSAQQAPAAVPAVQRAPSPPASRHHATRAARYARGVLDAACGELLATPRGARNNAATREAFGVGGLLWVGAYGEQEALDALLSATRAGSWDAAAEPKTLDTLARGLRDGAEQRRELPPETPTHGGPPSPSTPIAAPTSTAAEPAPRPTIAVREPELRRMVLEGISALAANDRNLYQRAGELVTVVREPDRAEPLCPSRPSLAEPCETCGAELGEGCSRDHRAGADVVLRPGTPRLRAISAPVLLERLSVAAQWQRFDGRAKEYRDVAPPSRVASIIAAPDREKLGIRPIRGLLEAPSLRSDGTIIEAPGYDEGTGYVLIPSAAFPAVPATPTQTDAADALRRLWIECFADFPYRGLGEAPADWRETDPLRHAQYELARVIPDAFVGLMALLTIVARPAIDGAIPAAIFEASSQGSGKSKQMHVVSVATTGRPAGVMTFPAHGAEVNEEELEKILGSYAVAGARAIAFDNVKARIGGPALEGKLTAEGVAEFRILGQTELVTLPWAALLMFSGNNLTMSDDVAQRSLLSRLESPREDPRSRPAESFLHADLLSHVRAIRPALICDALTVLRALYVAEPEKRPPPRSLGSFESWSRIVPRAIVYAGGPDVLDARPAQSSGATTDGDGDTHLTLMRLWPWDGPVKGKDILAELFDAELEAARNRSQAPDDGHGELRDAVRALCRVKNGVKPNGKAFGKALHDVRGKIRDGMHIESSIDRMKVQHWEVLGRSHRAIPPPESAEERG